ncbi:MAG TPA: hypothetical protein DEQ47_13635 [Solibacterales bacterium]|nr:hypothetical protein [Bryobacterales bacterium]
MRMKLLPVALLSAALLMLPGGALAKNRKHEMKEEMKDQDKAYREWLKAQGKADKEWAKADAKERKEYYKSLKKHGR